MCMRSFDFLFGAMVGELLLSHTDNLSKTRVERIVNDLDVEYRCFLGNEKHQRLQIMRK